VESRHPEQGEPMLSRNCGLEVRKGATCTCPYAKTGIKQARKQTKRKRVFFVIGF